MKAELAAALALTLVSCTPNTEPRHEVIQVNRKFVEVISDDPHHLIVQGNSAVRAVISECNALEFIPLAEDRYQASTEQANCADIIIDQNQPIAELNDF